MKKSYKLADHEIKKAIDEYVRKHGSVKDNETVKVTLSVIQIGRPGAGEEFAATAQMEPKAYASKEN